MLLMTFNLVREPIERPLLINDLFYHHQLSLVLVEVQDKNLQLRTKVKTLYIFSCRCW